MSASTAVEDRLVAGAAERVEGCVGAALRRRASREANLAGALQVLAPHSRRIAALLSTAVRTLVDRASFDRPLYAGAVRALSEVDAPSAAAELQRALQTEEAGGLATLSACCARTPALAAPLARVAGSRHPHVAFAAEVARIARGEADGEHLASLAPKIKESHRIALCAEIFVPLLRRAPLPGSAAPALGILRDSERHLGRWLVFGELGARAGDPRPLEEARARATQGPEGARAAWALVQWALEPRPGPPAARPTVDVVSRLSDRPSADRDPTFLYRLAEARCPAARPMLEGLVRGNPRSDSAVRAALYLARDHGRDDLRARLTVLAGDPKREGLRGLSAAVLHDLGEVVRAAGFVESLLASKQLCSFTWGALLSAARPGARLVTEPAYRRVQQGWLE